MKNSYKIKIIYNTKFEDYNEDIIAEFCCKKHAITFANMLANEFYHKHNTIVVLDQRKNIIVSFNDEYFNNIYNVEDIEDLPF